MSFCLAASVVAAEELAVCLMVASLKVILVFSLVSFKISLVWFDDLQFHSSKSSCGHLCIYPTRGLFGFSALFLVSFTAL